MNPLLLKCLEPGTRVRAVLEIYYPIHDLTVPEGSEGTVVHTWGVGHSFILWDIVCGRNVGLGTSHDALAVLHLPDGA